MDNPILEKALATTRFAERLDKSNRLIGVLFKMLTEQTATLEAIIESTNQTVNALNSAGQSQSLLTDRDEAIRLLEEIRAFDREIMEKCDNGNANQS